MATSSSSSSPLLQGVVPGASVFDNTHSRSDFVNDNSLDDQFIFENNEHCRQIVLEAEQLAAQALQVAADATASASAAADSTTNSATMTVVKSSTSTSTSSPTSIMETGSGVSSNTSAVKSSRPSSNNDDDDDCIFNNNIILHNNNEPGTPRVSNRASPSPTSLVLGATSTPTTSTTTSSSSDIKYKLYNTTMTMRISDMTPPPLSPLQPRKVSFDPYELLPAAPTAAATAAAVSNDSHNVVEDKESEKLSLSSSSSSKTKFVSQNPSSSTTTTSPSSVFVPSLHHGNDSAVSETNNNNNDDDDKNKDFLEIFLDTVGVDKVCGFDDEAIAKHQANYAVDDSIVLRDIVTTHPTQNNSFVDPFEEHLTMMMMTTTTTTTTTTKTTADKTTSTSTTTNPASKRSTTKCVDFLIDGDTRNFSLLDVTAMEDQQQHSLLVVNDNENVNNTTTTINDTTLPFLQLDISSSSSSSFHEGQHQEEEEGEEMTILKVRQVIEPNNDVFELLSLPQQQQQSQHSQSLSFDDRQDQDQQQEQEDVDEIFEIVGLAADGDDDDHDESSTTKDSSSDEAVETDVSPTVAAVVDECGTDPMDVTGNLFGLQHIQSTADDDDDYHHHDRFDVVIAESATEMEEKHRLMQMDSEIMRASPLATVYENCLEDKSLSIDKTLSRDDGSLLQINASNEMNSSLLSSSQQEQQQQNHNHKHQNGAVTVSMILNESDDDAAIQQLLDCTTTKPRSTITSGGTDEDDIIAVAEAAAASLAVAAEDLASAVEEQLDLVFSDPFQQAINSNSNSNAHKNKESSSDVVDGSDSAVVEQCDVVAGAVVEEQSRQAITNPYLDIFTKTSTDDVPSTERNVFVVANEDNGQVEVDPYQKMVSVDHETNDGMKSSEGNDYPSVTIPSTTTPNCHHISNSSNPFDAHTDSSSTSSSSSPTPAPPPKDVQSSLASIWNAATSAATLTEVLTAAQNVFGETLKSSSENNGSDPDDRQKGDDDDDDEVVVTVVVDPMASSENLEVVTPSLMKLVNNNNNEDDEMTTASDSETVNRSNISSSGGGGNVVIVPSVDVNESDMTLIEDTEDDSMVEQIMENQNYCCSFMGLPPR